MVRIVTPVCEDSFGASTRIGGTARKARRRGCARCSWIRRGRITGMSSSRITVFLGEKERGSGIVLERWADASNRGCWM